VFRVAHGIEHVVFSYHTEAHRPKHIDRNTSTEGHLVQKLPATPATLDALSRHDAKGVRYWLLSDLVKMGGVDDGALLNVVATLSGTGFSDLFRLVTVNVVREDGDVIDSNNDFAVLSMGVVILASMGGVFSDDSREELITWLASDKTPVTTPDSRSSDDDEDDGLDSASVDDAMTKWGLPRRVAVQRVLNRLHVSEFLMSSAGMRYDVARTAAITFGKVLKRLYVETHGDSPRTLAVTLDNGHVADSVFYYTEDDLPLFHEALAEWRRGVRS